MLILCEGYKLSFTLQVVATFILEEESKDEILRALNILKLWNPYWSPRHWMTDYSQAEISALEHSFNGMQCNTQTCLKFNKHLFHYPTCKKCSFCGKKLFIMALDKWFWICCYVLAATYRVALSQHQVNILQLSSCWSKDSPWRARNPD